MNEDFLAYLQGRGQSFNSYSAGNKVYNGSLNSPNQGPVGDKSGYVERDRQAKLMREALLRRLKARQKGNYMSSANLTPMQSTYPGVF